MNPDELKKRTKKFAVEIVKFVDTLPQSKVGSVIGYQIAKSGTSVGANYRSVCRSRSDAEFVSKITVCEEEADESAYWLEVLVEAGLKKREDVKDLWKESSELTAIFTSSGRTVKNKLNKNKK